MTQQKGQDSMTTTDVLSGFQASMTGAYSSMRQDETQGAWTLHGVQRCYENGHAQLMTTVGSKYF